MIVPTGFCTAPAVACNGQLLVHLCRLLGKRRPCTVVLVFWVSTLLVIGSISPLTAEEVVWPAQESETLGKELIPSEAVAIFRIHDSALELKIVTTEGEKLIPIQLSIESISRLTE